MKRALITGITGQDGSYLAEQLLEDGYEVFGIVRRTSTSNLERITHILDKVTILEADMSDQGSLSRAVIESQPHEIYNLAAQSFVGISWEQPMATLDITGMGAVRMLEAARMHAHKARFYQASSSEMYGNAIPSAQDNPGEARHSTMGETYKVYGLDESAPFRPESPYGVAKVTAHEMARVYRETYNMHISCGILFNHESPRRGEEFVTRKITKAVANIKAGKQDKLALGNLDSKRDWGFAGDYVRAMRLMTSAERPNDYVIATGETHSIRDFLDIAFGHVNLDWKKYVVQDPEFFRPNELHVLLGNATAANVSLKWEPETSFKELVEMMVDHDMENV